MSTTEQLVHQHILEYESRLKRMDELIARARRAGLPTTGGEAAEQLAIAERERDELSGRLAAFRRQPPPQLPPQTSAEAFEVFGPMGVWDTVAHKLENLVERLER